MTDPDSPVLAVSWTQSLRSGGTVRLDMEVDLARANERDRQYVGDLLTAFARYGQAAPGPSDFPWLDQSPAGLPLESVEP